MIRVLSEPRSEPVLLSEARRWLGMTDDNDDDQDEEIQLLVAAMTKYAEETITFRRFVDRELELNLDGWSYEIELPTGPVVSVDYIDYLDTDGVLQRLYDGTGSPTIGAELVSIDTLGRRVKPAYGETWPTLRGGDYNAVRIGFTAGYGTDGSPPDLSVIPPQLKLWIRRRIATLYEHREEIIVGNIVAELPRDYRDAILDPLVLGRRIA